MLFIPNNKGNIIGGISSSSSSSSSIGGSIYHNKDSNKAKGAAYPEDVVCIRSTLVIAGYAACIITAAFAIAVVFIPPGPESENGTLRNSQILRMEHCDYGIYKHDFACLSPCSSSTHGKPICILLCYSRGIWVECHFRCRGYWLGYPLRRPSVVFSGQHILPLDCLQRRSIWGVSISTDKLDSHPHHCNILPRIVCLSYNWR